MEKKLFVLLRVGTCLLLLLDASIFHAALRSCDEKQSFCQLLGGKLYGELRR